MKEEITIHSLQADQLDKHLSALKGFEKRWRNGWLIFICGILLIQFFLIGIKNLHPVIEKRLIKLDSRALIGQQKKITFSFSSLNLKSWFSGNWQKNFELWLSDTLPFKAFMVRLHNQVYYNVFSKSYVRNIVIGKDGYLFGTPYIEKYYNTSRKQFTQESFDDWADDLQALANYFQQRGQQFIYIITPSKASYFPEYLPNCQRCKHIEKRPDYYLATNTLKKRGFPILDASQLMLDKKKENNHYLFPKGGIHWTSLGAAYAMEELFKLLSEKMKDTTTFPEISLSYEIKKISQKKRLSNSDYAFLANLLYTPLNYLVPYISITPLPKQLKNHGLTKNSVKNPVAIKSLLKFENMSKVGSGSQLTTTTHKEVSEDASAASKKQFTTSSVELKKKSIAMVGGSFLNQLSLVLTKADMFDQIDVYNYLIIWHSQHKVKHHSTQVLNTPGAPLSGLKTTHKKTSTFARIPMKSNRIHYYPAEYNELFKADVVILEENEQNLRSNHFKLLLKRTLGKEVKY